MPSAIAAVGHRGAIGSSPMGDGPSPMVDGSSTMPLVRRLVKARLAQAKRQIAALAGLAPMTRQSGAWQGKSTIQGGRRHLRESPRREKTSTLREAGNPHKPALTPLMRKLIQLANTLVSEDRTCQPNPA